ncbi:MAG: hypothetical protein ACI8UO_005558 [Verrucomicrobiales bacterium]
MAVVEAGVEPDSKPQNQRPNVCSKLLALLIAKSSLIIVAIALSSCKTTTTPIKLNQGALESMTRDSAARQTTESYTKPGFPASFGGGMNTPIFGVGSGIGVGSGGPGSNSGPGF